VAESTDPASSGDAVGRRTFSTSFRGFDQAEVRAYLRVLAGEFSALRDRVAELEAELSAVAEPAPVPVMTLDIATVTSALGEETARVLRAAQEAAEDLRTRAEDGAARTLKEAHEEAARTLKEAQEEADRLRKEAQDEADRLQEEAETAVRERTADADEKVAAATAEAAALHTAAEQVLSERTAEAEASAASIREEATQAATKLRADAEETSARVRKEADEIATRLRKEAETQTAAEVAKAVEQGRDMLGQARAARERVLSDLARRRKVAVNQVELLHAGRERLQASIEAARAQSDSILEDLKRSDEEARRAADQAARQTPNSPALGPSGSEGADLHDEDDDQDEGGLQEGAAETDSGSSDGGPTGSPSDVGEASSDTAAMPAAGEGEPTAAEAAASGDSTVVHADDGQEGATAAGSVAPTSHAGPTGAVQAPGPPTAPPSDEADGTEEGEAAAGDHDVDLTAIADVDLRAPAPEMAPPPLVEPPAAVVRLPVGPPTAVSPSRPPYPHDPVPDAELPPSSTGAPPGRVDQLFARIRADRAPKPRETAVRVGSDPARAGGGGSRPTLRSRAAPSRSATTTPPAAADAPTGGSEDAAATAEPTDAAAASTSTEDPGLESPRSDEDESYLQRRDALLEAGMARAVRTAKRAFADDQNAALDRFRTLRPVHRNVDAVLGAQSAQVESLAHRVAPALADGATAGARLAGGDGAAPVDPALVTPVAERLAIALVEPFRRRLTDLFDDPQEPGSAALDRLNGVYREWRGRIEGAVGDAMTEAVSAGFATVVAQGSPVRWVVDDVGGPCADCDDNALAGACGFGSPFPTGQSAPPAHPGCRCVLARAAT